VTTVGGKGGRGERLVKALRDNLRRRKAAERERRRDDKDAAADKRPDADATRGPR
jgi:hypothetical protein